MLEVRIEYQKRGEIRKYSWLESDYVRPLDMLCVHFIDNSMHILQSSSINLKLIDRDREKMLLDFSGFTVGSTYRLHRETDKTDSTTSHYVHYFESMITLWGIK